MEISESAVVALLNTVKPKQGELLLRICNATQKPQVAIDMLIGVHQPPKIPQQVSPPETYRQTRSDYELVDYNPLMYGEVRFKYTETRQVWVRNVEEVKKVAAGEYVYAQHSSSNDYPCPVIRLNHPGEGNMDLEEWMKYAKETHLAGAETETDSAVGTAAQEVPV